MANSTISRPQKTKCRRCNGFMIGDGEALSCLLCGYQEYGAGFRPLTKRDPETARLEAKMPREVNTDEPWGPRLTELVHPLDGRLRW